MIPYDELNRALARWKARSQSGRTEVEVDDAATVVQDMEPPVNGTPGRRLTPPEVEMAMAEEIDEGVVETYEEDDDK
jgi:hypothetical protein